MKKWPFNRILCKYVKNTLLKVSSKITTTARISKTIESSPLISRWRGGGGWGLRNL